MGNSKIVNQSISYEHSSFFIIENNKIAIAEISLIPKEIGLSYLEDSILTTNQKNKLNDIINECKGIYFFNRLNVPKELQNRGYGKMLMASLIDHMKKNDKLLINTANAYGDMGQEDLISFYKKTGMTLINEQGLLIYHKLLDEFIHPNSLRSKIKP